MIKINAVAFKLQDTASLASVFLIVVVAKQSDFKAQRDFQESPLKANKSIQGC